jgi:hypothetical protein
MAGKKFAAEFALRRNVSAQDKILIQDSDDDVVKYAYPPQIASLSGYAYAQSVADLPLLPTNKSIGYIVGQMLYIYVGMGGDTKDGLYQSVGFFVGPQGVQGEKGEKGERGEQGVQGPKGDNGGLSLQEIDVYLAKKQYVTGDTLADMLADYVSNTSLMRDYVTIAKTQDVTGVKNFTAGVQFGGLPMYKSKDDTVYLDANLVVRGAVTMYGMNTTTSPSIFSTLPIDGKTIGRNERGELYVIGGTSGGGGGTGGGISIADVESYLTTNGYITSKNFSDYALPITGGTVNGAVTINHSGNTPLVINQNYGTVSNPRGVVVMNSTLSNNNLYISHLFGKEGSMRNSAWVGFYLDSAGSNNNRLSMGLYGVDNVLNILGSGNVAIGGTTADELLHVYGVAKATLLKSAQGYTLTSSAATYCGLIPNNIITGSGNATDFWLYNTTDIKYQAANHYFVGGNVAFGGTTATEKLHVHGNMLFEGERVLKSSLIGEVLYMGGSYLVIGGGTTTKGIPTYIDGKTVYVRAGNYVATFSDAGGLTWNGNLLTNGAITMYYSSDKRLKHNIRKVDASKTLMSLGGIYQYEYIDSEVQKNSTYGGSHYGLIYQNVKGTALDKMCFEREDGYGALNYLDTNFISLIAGATMENISEVEKLKRKIRTLENKVKQLEGRA